MILDLSAERNRLFMRVADGVIEDILRPLPKRVRDVMRHELRAQLPKLVRQAKESITDDDGECAHVITYHPEAPEAEILSGARGFYLTIEGQIASLMGVGCAECGGPRDGKGHVRVIVNFPRRWVL